MSKSPVVDLETVFFAHNTNCHLHRRPAGAGRASTDVASSNTYGTSAWGGSSSRAASTVRGDNAHKALGERRSTSRSSFASVTSVSSDDEMNLDNI